MGKQRRVLIGILLLSWQLAATLAAGGGDGTNCISVNNDTAKIICVCDQKFCDQIHFDWPQTTGQAILIETTQSGYRLKPTSLAASAGSGRQGDSRKIVKIDLGNKRQRIMGWGGAFTDAATFNIKQLSSEVGEKLLQSYFGPDGLLYNFGRVPIGGCDFSPRPYTLDDSQSADYNLTKWSLADEDISYKIPVIQRAMALVNSTGESLKLFGSSWSPPKWMKDNNSIVRGHLIDDDRIYTSYANYLTKFLDAYRDKGVEFWGATVQNEPISSYVPTYTINSLQLGNAQTIKFISNYLGPTLEARGYTKDNFKLMVGDDNLGLINLQVPQIMQHEGVRKYVSGLAFHWYMSGVLAPYNSLNEVVDAIRGQIDFVLMTEACNGLLSGKHVDLGSWERGEIYAADIIEDLKRETSGWVDWNLALNEEGGPSWPGGGLDSPIIVSKSKNEFYKQPMFYTLAHFSRFFRPNSVYTEVEVGTRVSGQLSFAAVQNEATGHLVVNVLNKASRPKDVELVVADHGEVKFRLGSIAIRARSMNTIILKL